MENKKIYAGNGKVINGKNGAFHGVGINLSKLKREASEYMRRDKNGDVWINLNIFDIEEDRFGNTATAMVNTWKPGQQKPQKSQEQMAREAFEDDVPF